VIASAAGERLPMPREVNLWAAAPDAPGPHRITSPLDPAEYGIDPLTLLESA
jgi:hypothetical protein